MGMRVETIKAGKDTGANPYIGYTPVTNAEYNIYNPGITCADGQDNYPAAKNPTTSATAHKATPTSVSESSEGGSVGYLKGY